MQVCIFALICSGGVNPGQQLGLPSATTSNPFLGGNFWDQLSTLLSAITKALVRENHYSCTGTAVLKFHLYHPQKHNLGFHSLFSAKLFSNPKADPFIQGIQKPQPSYSPACSYMAPRYPDLWTDADKCVLFSPNTA